jgi:signal transduction histidine kinase
MAMAWTALRSRLTVSELPVEALLATTVAAVSTVGVWTELRYSPHPYPAAAGGYLFGIVAAGALALRRRRPVLVSAVGLLAVLGYHLAGYPGEAPGMALFVAFYSVAAYGRTAWSLATCGVLVLIALIIPTLPPHPQPWYGFAVLGPAFGMAWMAVLGAAARQRHLVAEERVRRAAVTAEADLRERVSQERLRIARELHDVLAHTISVIAVQSGAALDSLDSSPEQARRALLVVRSAAREAMPELRAALGLLRGDRSETPDVLAQPRLEQLTDLVEQARGAGLRVRLTMPEQLPAVTPFLELTAYRIMQEALTNVVRHAAATEVTVSVRLDDATLLIDVRDNGRGAGAPGGTGLGLVGMRERAQLVGGEVRAGPLSEGGFGVHARLPTDPLEK